MKKKLDEYTKENLMWYVKVSQAFFYMGLVTMSMIVLGLNILPGYYVAVVGIIEMTISALLTIYVWIKQLIFIKDYDLKCNPRRYAKLAIAMQASAYPAIRTTATISGGFLMSNWLFEEFTGVNVMRTVSRGIITGATKVEIKQELFKQFEANNVKFKNKK